MLLQRISTNLTSFRGVMLLITCMIILVHSSHSSIKLHATINIPYYITRRITLHHHEQIKQFTR